MGCRIAGLLFVLGVAATSCSSIVEPPTGCTYDAIDIDWPVAITLNGNSRRDSLYAVGASGTLEFGASEFAGMKAAVIDGAAPSNGNGVSWALPFAPDGSIIGFTQPAPLIVGDSLPVALGVWDPVWGPRTVPDRAVRVFFGTYVDSTKIVGASGFMHVLRRAPFQARVSVNALQANGQVLSIDGTVSFSYHSGRTRCAID